MARLFFFNVPLAGHLYATLPLVRELVARGEEVIYVGSPAFRHAITATGATFRPIAISAATHPKQGKTLSSFALVDMVMRTTEALLPELLQWVAAEQPDYIISDFFCRWGRLTAQLTGRRLITTHPIFVATPRLMTRMMFQEGRAYLAHLPEFIPQWLRFQRISRTLTQRYGVKRLTIRDLTLDVTSDLNLVFTSEDFQPYRDQLTDNFVFVGPSIGPREVDKPLPAYVTQPGKPLVYLSLGTLFNQDVGLLNRWIEALRPMNVTGIVAYGAEITPTALAPKPDHFLYLAHAPQLQVLEQAALFITHGGLNSISEGIYHQTPLIVLPQAADQFVNAEQVAKHKVGIWLKKPAHSPAQLRTSAERVLADAEIAQNVSRLRQSFRAAGGYLRAADEILKLVKR